MKYFIRTFGCQQNIADSQRIATVFKDQGMVETENYKKADLIVINTCMIRESAENRVYGLINNLSKLKARPERTCPEQRRRSRRNKIILTGCMVGLAVKDKTGKFMKRLQEKLPCVDQFLPIEEVGFNIEPLRKDKNHAYIPISNGCNNFCTYCVVPYTRGREVSRPYKEIINEALQLKRQGYEEILLLGQNVNSYGADLIASGVANEETLREADFRRKSLTEEKHHERQNLTQKITYVKHLGRYRIPTLFPYLLENVAKLGFKKVNFISSNPWDFSKELIDVIARNKNISRTIHLPVQSGDDNVLKRMNRWYTGDEYLNLVANLKLKIKNLKLTTDIIVGFCGETDKEFKNTVKLCKKVGFEKAYVSKYSPRPHTVATKTLKDDIPHMIKEQRWQILEDLIYKRHF